MSWRITPALAVGCVLLLLARAPLRAHHSFAAEFDVNKPLKLQGPVTKWELINPHSWIYLDVKGADGKVTNWMVGGGSPNALFPLGFTKDSRLAGRQIVAKGYQATDSTNRPAGPN